MRLIFAVSALILAALPARAEQPDSARILPPPEEIHALLQERMRENGVGVVVGVTSPEGRYVVAYGKTGAPDDRPLDGDAIFQIGSITKGFTGLLLADMIVRGEVKADDPAAQYLPEGARMPATDKPVTLHDLATHMSGIPSMPGNFDLKGEPDPYAAYSEEELFAFLAAFEPDREPGEALQYSNLAVSLLGRLLAEAAGKDYETLLRERILEPLGMNSSAITLDREQEKRLIPGHDRYLRPIETWEMRVMPASGSLRSTANDMLTFMEAYFDPASPLADAMALQLSVCEPTSRGCQSFGWGVSAEGVVLHAGGKQGYRSGAAFDPGRKRGVVALANARTDDQPIALARHILEGEPLDPAPPAPRITPVRLKKKTLEAYEGRYRLSEKTTLTVMRKDGLLIIDRTMGGVSEFMPENETDFFLITGNDELTFVLDGEGKATGLTLYGDGRAAGNSTFAPRIGS